MKLTSFFVRRPQLTVVVLMMLVAVGVRSLVSIPKSEDPAFPIPTFVVIAIYPGASPSDVERLVVDPIESKLKSLDDVETMSTTIEDGLSVTQIEFTASADADKKHDDVQRQINALRPLLPSALRSIEIRRFNAATVNILQVALVSDEAPYAQLESLSDRLRKRLEVVPGVDRVQRWGYPIQEIRVSTELERMEEFGIGATQVVDAIQRNSVSLPVGSVDIGDRRLTVKTSTDTQRLEDVENIPISAGHGRVLRLSDIAKVELRDEEPSTIARYNGRRAVFVAVNQREGQNIFEVRKALIDALSVFRSELPSHTTLELGFDQSQNVARRLSGATRDFILAVLLVLATLLPLGLRAAAIVMISIPLSLSLGVAMLEVVGLSINQLSIVGFVVALGLLVDDSIVVVENITRFLRAGHTRLNAALAATQQISVSVVGCTATLIFAFLPLLFLPGTSGQFIRSLPMAVVFTILASLFVALTIIPFLASVALERRPEPEGNWLLQSTTRIIERSYRPVLRMALQRPGVALAVFAGLFAASLLLIPHVGLSLFPKAEMPQFMIRIETREGSNLAAADRAARFVESVLRQRSEVKTYLTNVGQGNAAIYYNMAQQHAKSSYADILVELKRYDPAKTPQFLDALRNDLASFIDARIEVKEFENGPPIDAPIAMRLLGDDPEELKKRAAELANLIEQTPGTFDVRNPLQQTKTDLRLEIDRERAALLGVPLMEIDRAVRLGLVGIPAGTFREPGSDLDPRIINVTLPRTGHATLPELERLTVTSVMGDQIDLRQVTKLGFAMSPTLISHYNKERSVTVTAFVKNGYNTDQVTKGVLAKLPSLKLAPGYRIVHAGELESREESFGGLGNAAIVACFGILGILVLEFRTFKCTLIVASVIPLGIAGGVLALFLSGNTLSFTGAIGFVALIGIEVKNSILLVDFTNQLRERGCTVDEALAQAGETRFVPVLLTTMTAVGGLLPLALEGSALYGSLAYIIIGGLLASTMLSRVLTPVLYKLISPNIEARTRPSVDASVRHRQVERAAPLGMSADSPI